MDTRTELAMRIGMGVMRFQDGTSAMDSAAAEVLALARDDLPLLTTLLQGDPSGSGHAVDTVVERLGQPRAAVTAALGRLEQAGYATRSGGRVDLTDHARRWIAELWDPLARAGATMAAALTTSELTVVAQFLEQACAAQEEHVARLRQRLTAGTGSARASRERRGGLSPAALRRVESFVEAHLEGEISLGALADRAELSLFHFARTFKATTGLTPRAFVETRRIARATLLLGETDRSIVQVALDSGFSSQSRLTTVFRKSTGETPARYRARLRET